ncbi:glutamate--tRNA ligase [Candidatus Margulisiibacteriota bacterium]
MTIRVRFAPSPTGNLHIGSVRTALFNWLFARHNNGKLILRIEDTDKERSTKAFEKDILDGLRWLGLDWDEGPKLVDSHLSLVTSPNKTKRQTTNDQRPTTSYHQSQRSAIYKLYVDQLLQEGKAYKDTGSPAIYFRVPREGETTLLDAIKGPITFDNSEIKDQVLLKSDGSVTYNFAVVIDDHEMGITHVIRGEDHISNSPKQILMYQALGFQLPTFAHLPMILGPDRSKLSKRHGATSVNEYKKQGFLPEAILNYLALLGWTPEDGQEIMDPKELITKFSLERVGKSNSIFDVEKLKWMNSERIKKIPNKDLAKICLAYLPDTKQKKAKDTKWFEAVIELIKDGLAVYADIDQLTDIFFEEKISYSDKDKQLITDDSAKKVLLALKNALEKDTEFSPSSIDQGIKAIVEETKLSKGKVLKPVRIAVTGRSSGPALKDTIFLLGKKTCLDRISALI